LRKKGSSMPFSMWMNARDTISYENGVQAVCDTFRSGAPRSGAGSSGSF
jgi:hypothetical protein